MLLEYDGQKIVPRCWTQSQGAKMEDLRLENWSIISSYASTYLL